MDQQTLDDICDNGVILNCQHLAAWAIAQAKGENPAPVSGYPRIIKPFGCAIVCDVCAARIAKATAEFVSGNAN